MKIIITETQFNKLNEIKPSYHFITRSNERFLDNDELDVYVVNKYTKETSKVASIIIPQNVIDEIQSKISIINNSSLKLEKNIIYVIITYKFDMVKLWKYFNFEPNVHIQNIINKLKKNIFNIFLKDPKTKTYGYYIVTIVLNNKIITTYLSLYNDDRVIDKIKKKYHNYETILVKNPEDIDFFDSDIITNNF